MGSNEYTKTLTGLVTTMCIAFRQQATQATFAAYELGLADLPLADVKRAITAAIRELKFLPTVAELRQRCGGVTPEARAGLAWNDVERAVLRHGAYATVLFEDGATNAAIHSMGGWERLCGLPCEEFDKWASKDFARLYLGYKASGVTTSEPHRGITDRDNNFHGFTDQIKDPVLIPDTTPEHRRITDAANS